MSRRGLVTVALTVLMFASTFTAGAVDEGASWIGTPTFIGGTSRYDSGEWIYTDFVYDDYGADTTPGGQPNVVSLAPTAGDFRYPAGMANSADIVEVRARVVNTNDLEVRVLLQTILDPNMVALQVDFGRTDPDSVSSRIITKANSAIDDQQNSVSFTLTDAAAAGQITLNIGAGLHDQSGGLLAGVPGNAYGNSEQITTGAPSSNRLFDAAFNNHASEGRGGAWNENFQSATLAGGRFAQLAQTIDTAKLRGGTTDQVTIEPGYYVRIFESIQNLGEGMGSSFPQYKGKWQPYAVWVPDGYDSSKTQPLFLSMHSLSVHHNQYRGGSAPSASYRSYYEQFGDALDAVVVTPLGRGPDGWYEDQALIDTLEVWANALASYSIDRDRILVGGYSMGGYGTYRLSTLMPDAFASAVSVVGPPANGIWAYPAPPTGGANNPDHTYPQLENTRHVPFWITQGVEDELVPFLGVTTQSQRFADLGHEYRFALHPAADHFAFAFQDSWSREANWFAGHPTRVVNPGHVTLKVRPGSWVTASNVSAETMLGQIRALLAQVGARIDGAYWVDDVVVAEGADVTGFVDLRSGGITAQQSGVSAVRGAGTDGPSPHVLTGQDKTWTTVSSSDTLRGALTGITALTIDVGRAGLSDDPLLQVTTDGPVTITFVRDGQVVKVTTLRPGGS